MIRELVIAAALLTAVACGETGPGERTAEHNGAPGGAQAGGGGQAGGVSGGASGSAGAATAGSAGVSGSGGAEGNEAGAGGVAEQPQGGLGGAGQAGEPSAGFGGENSVGDGGQPPMGGFGGEHAGGQGGSNPEPVASTCSQEDRDYCYSAATSSRGHKMCTTEEFGFPWCKACPDDMLDCNKADGDGCETSRLDPLHCGRCGHYCAEATPYCHPGGLCKAEPY